MPFLLRIKLERRRLTLFLFFVVGNILKLLAETSTGHVYSSTYTNPLIFCFGSSILLNVTSMYRVSSFT